MGIHRGTETCIRWGHKIRVCEGGGGVEGEGEKVVGMQLHVNIPCVCACGRDMQICRFFFLRVTACCDLC